MKRKVNLIVASLSLFLLSNQSFSASTGGEGFGIGVMLGEPSGVSAKYWISPNTAIAGGLTWELGHRREDHLGIHGDYLYHFINAIQIPQNRLVPYLGGGARLFIGNNIGIGVRVPIGIDFIFDSAPIGAFLEIVPIVDLIPDPDGAMSAAIGIRYFF